MSCSYHKTLQKYGYLLEKKQLSASELKKLIRELTVSPMIIQAYKDFVKPSPFPIYQENKDYIFVPRYYGIEKYGNPLTNYLYDGMPMGADVKFIYNLFPHQLTGYTKTLEAIKNIGGGVLQVGCGWGKTAVAIKIAIDLKIKTLVVVNKECLMDQWASSIAKFTNNKARIGILQQSKMDVVEKDFVISMLHSVSGKDYPADIFTDFGFCVVDECFIGETQIKIMRGINEYIIIIKDLYGMWQNKNNELNNIKILSYNEHLNIFQENILTYAWEKSVNKLIVLKINDDIYRCTPEHLFLTKSGYKKANELEINEELISYGCKNNLYVQCISYETYINGINVYDIEVKNNHNFIITNNCNISKGIVVHNCHHIASEMFSKALPKISSKYMLGLSATPHRKDGLSHVFHKYIGNVCHTEKRKGTNQVLIKRIKLTSDSRHYEQLKMSNGITNTAGMLTNLGQFMRRTELIIEIIKILITQDRKMLLLSGRREHLQTIHDLLDKSNIVNIYGKKITFGYYYGNDGQNKKKHKEMLEASAKCDIILGTHAIASEGLDIPDLNTLLSLTPVTEMEQPVGRILRKHHENVNPLVIDMIDSCGNFVRQASVRNKLYKSEGYLISDIKLYLDDNELRKESLKELSKFILSNNEINHHSDSDSDSDNDSDNDNEKNIKDINNKITECVV